jgi:hypothetical protein
VINNHLRSILAVGTVVGVALAPLSAHAILFTGSSGSLSASANFDVTGSSLVVTLTNTSTADVLVPADVLTGVYFSGVGALGSTSALLSPGSTVIYDPQGQPTGGNVGGEWGFGSGLAAPNGATAALMSTGALAGLGQPTFPGDNLAGPDALDGLQYGLVSAGDDPATGNAGVTGSGGLIDNSVTFTLSGLPDGFSLSSIGNVSFQYGTSLNEPIVPGTPGGQCPNGAPNFPICSPQVATPEPMSMAMLGVGMLGLGLLRRRRA